MFDSPEWSFAAVVRSESRVGLRDAVHTNRGIAKQVAAVESVSSNDAAPPLVSAYLTRMLTGYLFDRTQGTEAEAGLATTRRCI